MNVIDTVPVGVNLNVMLNGRALGIVETDPEVAFTYWARRQAKKRQRAYTLLCDRGITYRIVNGEWRAV